MNWWTTSTSPIVQLLLKGLTPNIKYSFAVYTLGRADSFSNPAVSNVVVSHRTARIDNVGTCSSTQICDFGPRVKTYATFGNDATKNLNDCSFAAAADWETIVLGTAPDPSSVIAQYNQANFGTNTSLSFPALLTYWESRGIGGTFASGAATLATDRSSLEANVLADKALVAQLELSPLDQIGHETMAFAGSHFVVVDGFTPAGPLVVTWGSTVQMTWAQWNTEAIGSWNVTVRGKSTAQVTPNADSASAWSTWTDANQWSFFSLEVARAQYDADVRSLNTSGLLTDISNVARLAVAVRESAFSPSATFNSSATQLANDLTTMGSACSAYWSSGVAIASTESGTAQTNCSTAANNVQVDLGTLSTILQSVSSIYVMPALFSS